VRVFGAILIALGLYALLGPPFALLLLGRAGLIGQIIIGIALIAGGVILFIKARGEPA